MGIYSGYKDNSDYNSLDLIMEDDSIVPWKNDDFLEGSLECLIIANENYNTIMQSIGINELNYLEENGEEYVYTEASLDGFIMAIKKFLVRLWRSISGVFKRFIYWFDRQTKNDKDFLHKYRERLLNNKLDSDFSFSGYRYTIVDKEIDNAIGVLETDPSTNQKYNDSTNYGSAIEKQRKDVIYQRESKLEDEMEKLRAKVIEQFQHRGDKRDKLTGKEFHEALMECFQNGTDSKDDLNSSEINIHGMVSEMENGNATRKTIRLAFSRGKKLIDNTIRKIDNETRDISRQHVENPNEKNKQDKDKRTNMEVHTDKLKGVSYYLNYAQKSRGMLTILEGSVLTALKKRSKQYKACIIKVITYKGKNESYNESYDNFLSDLVLK